MLGKSPMDLLREPLEELERWLESQPAGRSESVDGEIIAGLSRQVLAQLVERLKGNYPFQSGIYAGQMLKPPHEIAWAAYALTSLINPNNHALDGGPPTSEMEKELIPVLATLFGFQDRVLGHLTSSGTIANLEALWVARKVHPGKAIGFSTQAHYTHSRMCEVLGVRGVEIPVDARGNWDLDVVRERASEIGTMVVTMGTTGMGRVEPLHEIIQVCSENGIRVHLDAAYGGYFSLLARAGVLEGAPWELVSQADSVVIDPHKHGLQPYGCGCVLFRDPTVGRYYKHDSPYTYFSSDELHLGEISLECSRAGAAAAALWATIQVFDLNPGGLMESLMSECRTAALELASSIRSSSTFHLIEDPQLDIVVYAPTPVSRASTTAEISRLSESIFHEGMTSRDHALFLSLYKLPSPTLATLWPDVDITTPTTTVLRSVLMKPQHRSMVQTLMHRLNALHRAVHESD
jgi:glutamate/tyrosine decarboxylase-like PLP-dependent enzyme